MRTELPALLAAVLLHAALLGVRWILPAPASLTSQTGAEVHTIDIDSLDVPVAPAPPPDRTSEPPPDRAPAAEAPPPSPEARVASATTPRNRGPIGAEPVGPAPESTTTPSAPPGPAAKGPDYYDPLPDDGRGTVRLPGIGAPPVWTLPGGIASAPPPPPAPTQAPRARPVDKDIAGQVIREAMRTNDKSIGLDLPAAGTVSSTLRDTIYSSDTPDSSRATFEVRLSGDGKVLGVRVASFSGGSSALWERAAQAATAALKARSLRMNESVAKGATIYVDVVSALQLPSGSTSVIRQQGAGASFDLSDIGTHQRKVVKTSYRVVAAR